MLRAVGRGSSITHRTLMMPRCCIGTNVRCETNYGSCIFQPALSSLIDWATPGPGIKKDQNLYQHHCWFVKPRVELMLTGVILKITPVDKLPYTDVNIFWNLVNLHRGYDIVNCHECCKLLIDTAVANWSTCGIWSLNPLAPNDL
jgi:hypothetical protein